jgi:hypothetical protein
VTVPPGAVAPVTDPEHATEKKVEPLNPDAACAAPARVERWQLAAIMSPLSPPQKPPDDEGASGAPSPEAYESPADTMTNGED